MSAEPDEMDDAEVWRAMRERSQEKRAANRKHSTEILKRAGVTFTAHNAGAHLIIKHAGMRVDFWPGTGVWSTRAGRTDRGVLRLLSYLGVSP